MSYCPLFKIHFPDFFWLCFHISEWKLVASFRMKSYRSSLTFITVDLLFNELLPFVRNGFTDFSFFCMKICRLNLKHQTKNTSTHMSNFQLYLFFMKMCDEILVADLNLLGPVGDLYCFQQYSQYACSLCYSRFAALAVQISPCKWNQPWHTSSQYPVLDKVSIEKHGFCFQ